MDDSSLYIVRCFQMTSESKGHFVRVPAVPILLTTINGALNKYAIFNKLSIITKTNLMFN